MNIKERLQRVLQMVEESELLGSMSELDRDVILAELREVYSELKFGVESGVVRVDNEPLPTPPVAEVAETDDESDEDSEVEVELIFEDEEEIEDRSEEVEDRSEEVENKGEEEVEDKREEIEKDIPTFDAQPSTFDAQTSTPKRSVLLSLYEEESKPVIGELFSEKPSVADTIACPKGLAEITPVVSLRESIGVADKFMLIRELFDGDSDKYESAIASLDSQRSFDDCVIYITENYSWSAQSQATKTIMSLLQRKFNE